MRKPKTAFLLLNGEAPKKLPNNISEYGLICATDGSHETLQEMGITPDLVTGDFDSSKDLPDDCEIVHTPDQNFTDFDKVLKILFERGYHRIDVYGAGGKEHDHFLGNLHTALLWKYKIDLTFFDDYGHYFFAPKSIYIPNIFENTVSLFPFPEAKKVTTKGLQYPLLNEDLAFGSRIGTRNKAIENSVEIKFESGSLIVFINHS